MSVNNLKGSSRKEILKEICDTMDKKLNFMVERLQPSQTLAMLSLARQMEQQGTSVVHMELGEPDIPSPESVKQAAIQAIEENFTQYTVVEGIYELREKVLSYYKKNYNTTWYNPNDHIIMTPGAKTAIFYTFLTILNPGDEVIIPTPAWVSYAGIVKYVGATPVFVDCLNSETGLDVEAVAKVITPKTKIILANFPTNPTSRTIPQKTYDELAELLHQHPDIYLVSDEIYAELTFNGSLHSFNSYPFLKDQLILISGFSKSHSMTGYRLGWAIGPDYIIKKFKALQGNGPTCPTSFVQKAGLAALDERQHILNVRKIYRERASLVVDLLKEIPSVTIKEPQGAFYAFPRIEGVKKDFAMELLKQKSVAGTSGSAFGPYYEDYIRLSFATSEENINEGLARLKSFVVEYKK